VIVALPEVIAKASSAMTLPPEGIHNPDASIDREVVTSLGRSDTALYGPLRDWMAGTELCSTALKVGDSAPDFFLPDDNAQLVSTANLLANGPVVIGFIGGGWCSFCVRKMRALSASVRDLGAVMVAITPETGRYPREMKAENQLDCVVLSDVDYGVGLQFGVIYAPPPQIVAQMMLCGLDLARMHGVTKPMLPAPGVYVVSRSGKITYAKVDLDYTAAADISPVLSALA
jgi:peroxiredoxin